MTRARIPAGRRIVPGMRLDNADDCAGADRRLRSAAAVETGRADLPHALARSRDNLQDERDRALAGEIATGTLRWQAAFDHIIAAVSRRARSRSSIAEVLDILRLTIFQLLHLDRVPASAAVNDAVEPDAQSRQEERRGSRERPAAARQPRAAASAVAAEARFSGRSRCGARLSRDYAVASALAGCAVARSATASRRRKRGRVSTMPPPRSRSARTA